LAIWLVFTFRYLFRYQLQGRDVLFVCGSDEHGVAISMKAKRRHNASGSDKYDGIIRKSFSDFVSFDNYSNFG
jgi:methionyl-tRNA synthetase